MSPLFSLLFLLPTLLAYRDPLYRVPPKGQIGIASAGLEHRYIIKLKPHVEAKDFSGYVSAKTASASGAKLASVASAFGTSEDASPYGVRRHFNKTIFNGLSAVLTQDDVAELKAEKGHEIEYIEPDNLAYALGVQQNPPSWGLSRVGNWNTGAHQYTYPDAAGQGVDVYILDTGLNPNHPSFGGRAKMAKNFVREEGPTDGNGHGTHVAGTIGSSLYGVAKKVRIHGVKVLNTQGSGLYSRIMSAIDYVVSVARPGKTVVNLSLAGDYSRALNDAMAAARKKGVVVVVAAGNEHQDACRLSPASSVHVLTVGATDPQDQTARFSNWGKCVDVYGPGTDIVSLDKSGGDRKAVMSGTSMASPHVAGIVALFMSVKSYNNADSVVRDVLGWSHRCVKGTQGGSGKGMVYANPKM